MSIAAIFFREKSMLVRSCLIILPVSAFLSLIALHDSCACSPSPSYSSAPAALRRQADEVFLGQVRSVVVHESSDLVSVRFRVSRAWKGSNRKIRNVITHVDSATCGLGQEFFLKGREYLVYATKNSQRLLTGSLSGTKDRANAKADLKYLNKGARIL
jgi:hypothetical protein